MGRLREERQHRRIGDDVQHARDRHRGVEESGALGSPGTEGVEDEQGKEEDRPVRDERREPVAQAEREHRLHAPPA